MALGILLYHSTQDKIISIAITAQPTTRTYTVNSSGNVTFNFSGAVVTATYKSGKTEDVTSLVTWSPLTDSITTVATSKTTTVTATLDTFTATTTMTVKNPLASIAITQQPTTQIYTVNSSGNATFDFTGAVVTATFTNGTTKTVTPTWSPTTGSITNTSTSASVTVTASYTEASVTKTATTTMTLSNPLKSIAITQQPTTTTYTVNSGGVATFSSAGAVVTATYTNNKTATVTATWSPATYTISDTSETKSVTYTATYGGKTASTTMTVNNPVKSLAVSPTSQTYLYGATPSGTVTATLTNGKTKTVTATKSPSTIAGNTTSVTFSYGGKSCSQTVTVKHELLTTSNGNTWSLWVGNSSSTGGSSSVLSDGCIYMEAGHWLGSGSDMRAAYKKLTNCTRVKRIVITYRNLKNDFNTAATWFAVGSTPTAAVFYSGNSSSGEIKASNVGGSTHSSTTTLTFTWDSVQNLSNYYIWGKVTVQGNTLRPNLSLVTVTAYSA